MVDTKCTIEHLEADETRPVPPLVVATVFEDSTTARHAQHLIGHILRLSGQEMPVEDTWGFHVFEQPDGMAAAARRAGAADVLIIAAYRDSAALEPVIEWLQHWVAPRRKNHGALVSISIEREAGRTQHPIEERLAHVARQIGMDFFATHTPLAATFPCGDPTALSPHESPQPQHSFRACDE